MCWRTCLDTEVLTKPSQEPAADRRLRDLVQHFNKHRLRNEDFEFPDLLGEVAEPGQYTRRGLADGEGSPVRRYCARTAATTIEAVAGRATGLDSEPRYTAREESVSGLPSSQVSRRRSAPV